MRWTDRVASVRPFAKSIAGIRVGLEKLHSLNLTPKTSIEVNGALRYLSQFTCVIMSSMWLKILVLLDDPVGNIAKPQRDLLSLPTIPRLIARYGKVVDF